MASPMQRVSALVSGNIGDYLTNVKTWGNVMYNVLEHGLIGDGVTDDTAALQTLINTAVAAGRRTIYFPHTPTGGQYYVTSLTDADKVDFMGDNCSFVGGYDGSITNLGSMSEIETEINKKIDRPLVGETKVIQEDDVYNSWPSLVKTSTGRLLCMYNSGASHTTVSGGVDVPGRKVCLKYSDDMGITWSNEIDIIYSPTRSFMSHAIIGLSNGNILVAVEEFLVGGGTSNFTMNSTNNGLTWTMGFNFSSSTDAAIRAAGNCNMFLELSAGNVMSFKHVVYGAGQFGVSAIFSSDYGATWNTSTVVVPATNSGYSQMPWEIRGELLGSNRIIAIGRNDLGNLYQITSSNNGSTWTVATTNISDARAVCADLVYFSEDDCLVLYYSDRNSNTIKRRVVSANLVFSDPTQWLEAQVVGYTASNLASPDFGYITAIRSLSNKREIIAATYTTREAPVANGTPKGTAIVELFDSVNTRSPATYFFKDVNSVSDKIFDLYKGDGTNIVSFRVLNGVIMQLNGYGITITGGFGSPNGVITANIGSLYLRRDGAAVTTLYIKESGNGTNTGWVAK